MKYLVKKYATLGIAVSKQAASSLFGPNWETDQRWQIMEYGINVNSFQKTVDKDSIRKELGIPSNTFIVGHVGRFSEAKNHPFIIDVFTEILKIDSSIRLLLVGDGENLIDIKRLALRKEVEEKIIFIEQQFNQKLNEQIKKRNELVKIKINQMTRDANMQVQQYMVQNAITATIEILEKKLNQSGKQKLVNQSIVELSSVLKH